MGKFVVVPVVGARTSPSVSLDWEWRECLSQISTRCHAGPILLITDPMASLGSATPF